MIGLILAGLVMIAGIKLVFGLAGLLCAHGSRQTRREILR